MSDEEIKKYYEIYTAAWKIMKEDLQNVEGMSDSEFFRLLGKRQEWLDKYGSLKPTFVLGLWDVIEREVSAVWMKSRMV